MKRIFRRLLPIMGIMAFLSSLFGCGPRPDTGEHGENGIGKKAVDNNSGVTYFYYSYNGSIGGDSYSYTVEEEDGKVVLRCEFMEHPDYGEMTKTLDPGFLDKLTALYKECRLAEWDGFSKYNEYVMDGDGFSLSLRFADGASMSAHGSNSYPDGYSVFKGKMTALFEPAVSALLEENRQAKIGEGIRGDLEHYLAVFIQKGTSGSDEYHIMMSRNQREGRTNAEIRIRSASGEFLPRGEYNINKSIPGEELRFDEVQALIEKYDVIRWYDYDKAAEDYNNAEWFQLSFRFDGGTTINALGTAPPENYAEFRRDFLKIIAGIAADNNK